MSVPAMSIITGILLFMLLSVFNAQAANRYAVVTGNWNSTATWSATSGGTGGASVPVAGDAVYIEGGHNVTITANAGCSSVSFTTTTATLLNINAGITLDVSGAVTIPKSGSSVNTLAVGAGFLNAGSVSFTGTGSTKRHEITISTGTVMVTGNVSGTTTSATITFTGAGLLKLGGAFFTSSTGTLTPATGTVEYNASGAQTVGDFAYNNLTLSGSGAKTTDAVTVNGILSMEGTATVTIAPTYGTSASLVYNTATSHVAGLEWVTPFAATGGITIANTGTISLNSAEVFNASIPLIINSGASLSTAGFQLTLGGDFINNGGTFNAGSSPVVISNTKLIQSIDGFTTTGLVSVTKSAGIATMQNNVTAGGLTINGTGGTLNLGAGFTHSVTGAVTLSAGTLNGGTNTILAVSGNWTRNSGVYAAGTGSVNFIGGSLQTIGGSSSTTFNNLGINNSAGVSLSIAVAVGGTLTLTSGVMTTGSSALTVSNSSSTAVTGGSATSFISGPLTWSLSAGQTYSFPVGKSSTYLPFGLTGITGTNPQIRVEAFSGNTGGTASPPLTSLSTTEYWFASVTANTYSGGSVSLTRQAALNEFEAVGRNASSLNGAYGSLNGTVSGTSIINSDNTGNSLGYFVMASKLSITTGTINPASYCPGSSVIVPYSKTGTFSAGNVFTAQLSDAVGSFASPVIIGSLASQLSGTISATIPVGQSSGSGYRIRVVSSSPSFTGSDNGVNLYIGGPVITATYPGSSCGPGPVVLGATASFGTISWYAAATGGSALGTGTTFTTPSLSVTTTYYVDVISGSCTSAPRTPVMAYIITPPTMTAGGGGTFCYSSNITLTSSGTNISNQYWEGPNSFYSVEQNPVISAATTAMSGTYTVTGSALSGINLVANGDFELGNVGFGSGYVASSDLLLEGTYAVVADPRSVHSGYSTCADHTPSGTLQMVVNGSIIAGVNVWTQTVSVLPGTDYQFSYWVQSVVASNPSQLQLYINGVAAGPVYTALLATCQWKQFVYNWNSGASSSAILSLQNQNTIATGNDFTLDDILFQSVCTATAGDFATGNNGIQLTPVISSTVLVTVNANVTAGSIGTAQSICRGYTPATLTSVAAGTGSGTITYEWQTNASGSFATVSGATSATYSPPALSTTTIYQRRTVSLSGGTTCYSPYTSQITITVTGPTVSAGGPNSVCQSASPTALTLTGASFGGATTAAWSIISGGGVLSSTAQTANPSAVTYTPAVNYSGTVILRLTTNAVSGCASIADRTITVSALPVAVISYAGTPFCISVTSAQTVTRTGTAGGTYTASPAGLTIDAVTGSVTPSTSTAGSYTVTYTIASSGGCSIVTATTSVTITSLPVATFSYTGTPYCSNGTNPTPVFSGGGVAGTFSSTAGLNFVSTSTGQVNLSTSTPGTYTVTNTIGASGGCALVSSISSITITTLPAAAISYAGSPFCKSVATAQAVTRTGSAGGTYTASPAGLTVDAVTGSVTPSTSTAGSYTVTYTIASSGGCSIVTATTPVTITAVPTATISYAGTPFCTSVALAQPVTLGGTGAYSGGTYAATPAGLTINASTGAITPGTSTAGSYTITYTVPSSGGCAAVPVTTPVVITAMPSATISYAGTPFCQTVSSSQPVTLTGTQGGAFSASPAGLVISPATGAITPGSSASGSYTVTYSIPASGGCAATSATTNVTVNALPVATFSYTGSPYCSNAANPLPTFSGGGVAGIFSSSPGLVFVSTATGEINLLSTTPGTYSVVNNIAANGGCEAVSASSLVTVNPIAPQTPGAISGTTSQCPGQTDQSYSITAVAGATVYTWSVPAGWTITSGAGTTSIRVTTGTAGQNGNISVTAGNDCGTSSASTLAVSVSPVEVVASLGSADACYPTLKAAFDKINDGTHGGVITIKLHGSTTETISAVLNASGTGSASFTSVNIFPTVTGVVISGNLATPLIDLNGADNVTIDGRVNALGSSKDLVVTNSSSSSAAATSTIRFANNASANTIKYCVLKGSETATTGGIVFFSTSSSAGTGNDNNLIDNNNITCDADANRPLNAIYSAGTSSKVNSGNTISNNNIYDFLSRSATSNGINIAGNSQDFTISGNSFYETSTLVVSASSVIYNVIYLNNSSGTGFSVSGNYIGGKSAQCGGDAWSKNTQNSVFSAINVNVGTAVASSIQNNTIRNFSWSNSSNASWTGINVAAGAVNIGTLSGNVIGASSGTNSIVITAASNNANLYGINIAGTGSVDCQNNFIGSITAANGSSNASNIFGINRTAEVGTTTISNNTIGSATTDNSINASSASTSNNQNVYGIFNNGTGTITVNNNTIANLTNGTTRTTTSGTGRINGITSVNGINVISGNTIYDLSIANGNTALNNSSVCGIALTGSTLKTVTGNTIYNLSNTYASFAGDVIGLYFTGNTGANLISGNFIHSLSITGVSSTIGEVYGIVAASGSATYSNNIINLGGNTKTTLYGIYETGASGNSDGLYFNTVYIGGTLASGSTNKSYALFSAGNSNTCNFRDNIFVNERSTTGGSSLHHGIYFAATGGSFTTDYNDYFVSGTGSVLGYYGSNKTSLSAWQAATSQDSGSLDANPDFTLAGSTVTTDYKIHRDLPGITISGITTDFGGTLRVLPSMGAWEKNLRKWKGSVSNNFANAANWSDGTVPLAGESVIFDDNPDQDCYLDQDRTIGSLTINQALDKMVLNGYRLSLNSNLNLTDGGKIDAASANSTMAFTGSSLQTINAGAFVQNSVANLTVNNSVGVSLTGDLDVNGNLDLANGPLQLGTVTLGINGSITRTAGSVTAGSTSGVKIGGSGSQLIIPANCFTGSSVNDFTINRASGVSLSSSLSVSGILDLHVANPSSTRGCLETGNNILSMGALSTTTGPGDVNGIVTRSSFPSNGPYSFGNQFTTMTFSAGGTVPSTIGVKITLGAAPSWKPDAILRTYDIIQSGGTAKPVSMNLHYLNSELNGIPDTLLYAWDFHAATNPIRLEKRTRTSQSTTDHWVGTSLTDVGYFGTSYNEHPWTLARTNYVTFMGLKGWRMITAPTITTSSDILSNFISQGVAGSSYPGKQPNFLWFNETDTLTTNMSWRTSKYDSIIVPGRGYYFYVFDSVSQASAAAPVYSDKLPRRMTSSGNAYFPGNFSYSLSNHHVTFTPRVGGQTHTSVNDTIFYDTNVDDQGWNLLGNPTLSTLNWNSSHGWTKTNLDSTIYIWDPAINQFRVWNGINGNLGSGLISPFQAFWVRANNPNPALSFTDEVLTTGGTFYGGTSVKSAQFNPVPSAINLNLKSAGLEGDIIVSFKEDGKVGPDPWDAYRLQPLSNSSIEVFTLSSPSHTMPLVINNLPSDGPDCIILPLYTGGQLNGREITGTYTLNWELPPDWPADWAISLNDHSEKKAISMKREHSYTFTIGNTKSSLDENAQDSVSPLVLPSLINPVSVSSRLKSSTGSSPFSIVIQKGSTKDDPIYISPEPNLLPNFPNPFADQTTIRLSLPSAAYVTLKIFDIRGVLIDVVADRNYEAGSYSIPWTRNGQNAGIYLLQMDAGAVVKTKKLVIIN